MTDDTNNSAQPTDSSIKTNDNYVNQLFLPDDDTGTSTELNVFPAQTTLLTDDNIPWSNKHVYSIDCSASTVQESHLDSNKTNVHNTTSVNEASIGKQSDTIQQYSTLWEVCEKICIILQNRNHKVWMDKNNLHGGIHEAMARAIESSLVVLVCFNHQYCQSYYCIREILYTVNKHIKFIPCLMEASFEPQGSVGIAIGSFINYDHPYMSASFT
ncbi:unnamed protein product [Rotaria magnacalcarata]|uniref:TIR domain-containing protein n=1 Tax=Rotaria magnacalcarata TaxID=392030 RepID=A0A819S330_9BILA|nr:unnamed protein product [Rotaria magnacalcarata]CAF4055037.1 unnamed protein product [Rotaria magnacalcarata]